LFICNLYRWDPAMMHHSSSAVFQYSSCWK